MEAILNCIDNLSPSTLDEMDQFYTENSTFQDPFNKVRGRSEIKRLFKDMFKLDDVRFDVLESIQQDNKAFLTWDMYFTLYGKQQKIHGGSYIHFDEQGRVISHRDYWDAAEEVYEKIPLLGGVLRMIKKRFQ